MCVFETRRTEQVGRNFAGWDGFEINVGSTGRRDQSLVEHRGYCGGMKVPPGRCGGSTKLHLEKYGGTTMPEGQGGVVKGGPGGSRG